MRKGRKMKRDTSEGNEYNNNQKENRILTDINNTPSVLFRFQRLTLKVKKNNACVLN